MARLQLWRNNLKTKDYKFTDRIISEYFGASGTAVYVHLYQGTYDANGNAVNNPSSVQDVLFLENRDRVYSKDVYEFRAIYNVTDNDFDMRQFGLFLTGDTLFIEFHLNDMLNMVGRKLMSGDVLELPHQRDDALLDPTAPAINKYYVVEDASRASEGYSSTWFPHIWRVRCSPITNSQEYKDILDQQAQNPFGMDQGRLGDILSSLSKDMEINEAVVESAKENVKKRFFETRQYYLVPDENGGLPWMFCGDGTPPNGIPFETGTRFPLSPAQGDYYLRTDYAPPTLFRYVGTHWKMQEIDIRDTEWNAANWLLESFINNRATTTFYDGVTENEKQGLYQAVKPRADF
jgi:hypothetical protein